METNIAKKWSIPILIINNNKNLSEKKLLLNKFKKK